MKKIGFTSGLNALDPAAYKGWAGELFGCVSDARVNQAGYSQYGFSMDTMLNEEVTKAEFESSIITLADMTESGDSVAITHSGHGSRYYTPLLGHREYFCLWDGQFSDVKFISLLARFKPGVRVIVELDTCHSGGFNRGEFIAAASPSEGRRTRYMPRELTLTVPEPLFTGTRGKIQCSLLMFTACRPDETALDGYAMGAYTECRHKAQDQFTDRIPTFREWFEASASIQLRDFPTQHPVAHRLGTDDMWETQVG